MSKRPPTPEERSAAERETARMRNHVVQEGNQFLAHVLAQSEDAADRNFFMRQPPPDSSRFAVASVVVGTAEVLDRTERRVLLDLDHFGRWAQLDPPEAFPRFYSMQTRSAVFHATTGIPRDAIRWMTLQEAKAINGGQSYVIEP